MPDETNTLEAQGFTKIHENSDEAIYFRPTGVYRLDGKGHFVKLTEEDYKNFNKFTKVKEVSTSEG